MLVALVAISVSLEVMFEAFVEMLEVLDAMSVSLEVCLKHWLRCLGIVLCQYR